MSRVRGEVVASHDGRLVVSCAPAATSCASCASGSGCGWRRAGITRTLTVPVAHAGSFQPGDAVDLTVDDDRLLGAAARLYLPPVAGLLLAPLCVRLLGWDAGVVPLVAALVGLVAGAMVARALTRGGAPVAVASAADPGDALP